MLAVNSNQCHLDFYPVSAYPHFDFNLNDLKRASKVLGRSMPYEDGNEEQLEKYRLAFRHAYSWRDVHIYPMRKINYELSGKRRAKGRKGISYSRLKRMPSIRNKLSLSTTKLNQMQDLGG